MNIVSIGGGPAGLYFSILMKKAFPASRIRVLERNRPDDTFGWGVVFSDETLGNFEEADPESFAAIRASFAYWSDIETFTPGGVTRSTGHGFCGLSRRRLLNILQDRCRELGVQIEFQVEVDDLAQHREADLILAADGVNSRIRERYADSFRPDIDWRKAKFCWLGTTLPLKAFTFIFKPHAAGLFQVHAYPFEAGLSTFIVECREETWKRAGLDKADEADTVRFCEELFADHLQGHRLLTNRSLWRTFPTIRNQSWCHENIVLMGDAAHTAHFSIGSGTKLAMEDAIALVKAFKTTGTADVPAALRAYEESRLVDVIKTQKAAQTSLEWFENSARYIHQEPLQFQFNLMTRSKRITYDNLKVRDPALVADTTTWFSRQTGVENAATPPVFTPFQSRQMRLKNRLVVSPMCQYSASEGTPNDWHLVHLGSRAIGGAGLVISEATSVTPEGRITPGCTGLYTREHAAAWKRIVDFTHTHSSAKIGIQIGHAGRKGSSHHPWNGADRPLTAAEGAWTLLGPSALPLYSTWPTPKSMDSSDMKRVLEAFRRAVDLAEEAGFDLIELHMAHGYLLSSFLSPLTNQRNDAYGGDLNGRMAFPLEVFGAVRELWPREKPLAVRVSATDWLKDRGQTPEDTVVFARQLKERGCDLIDVSTAGNVPESRPDYGRMYQVPFAEQIRFEAGLPVMAVGAILNADHANTVITAGRADLCCLARPHLRDPYLALHAAESYGFEGAEWPGQYLAAKSLPKS